MSIASVGQIPISPAPHTNDVRPQAVKQVDSQHDKEIKSHVVKSTAADLQRLSHAFNKKLQFEVDQSSNQVIVKVIDKETDKVIKELPPEELQRLHSNLKEIIGLLFDEMV
ncbi:MAG: flagellar protein FlaG [Treponema sp.]|nr:flagellar protein FlaG [Treponema sp.]